MSVINTDAPIFDGVVAQLGMDPVSGWHAEAPTKAAEPPAKVKRPLRRKRPVKAVQA